MDSTSEIAMNLDCLVNRSIISPVYANLIGISILPLILMVLTIIMWTIIKIFKTNMSYLKYHHNMKGTVINILFLVYPMILRHAMQMFACTTIEGT